MDMTSRDMAERRVAFVIGNGEYLHVSPLKNPRSDAAAMAHALQRLGFTVVEGCDLDHDAVVNRFTEFEKKLPGSDVSLFYYSGHGLQIDGVNYLVPIDADMESESFLHQIVSIQDLMERASAPARVSLVFLDACRDNPFTSGINERRERYAPSKNLDPARPLEVSQGLAQLSKNEEAFRGQTYVAFAAAPGEVAFEGEGELSFFTDGLVEHMETTDLSLDHLMTRVKDYVQKVTSERQTPWGLSSLRKTFYFSPGTLVWFNANIIGFLAFIVSFIIYSIVLGLSPGATWVFPIAGMMATTFVLLLLGLHRSFRFLRGDFRGTRNNYCNGVFLVDISAAYSPPRSSRSLITCHGLTYLNSTIGPSSRSQFC